MPWNEIARDWIGLTLPAFDEKAGVIIGARTKLKDGKPVAVNKFPSTCDLRRTLGFPWSR